MRDQIFSARRGVRQPKQAPNPFTADEDEIPLFDPHQDPLGDFGLDDEEAEPQIGDFWIERPCFDD
jgi:hypothetical protein